MENCENCGHCRFGIQIPKVDSLLCGIEPPRLLQDILQGTFISAQPQVNDTGWCAKGEAGQPHQAPPPKPAIAKLPKGRIH